MYSGTGCMCQDPVDCYTIDHPFYRYTMNGLDAMLKQFFYSIESLLKQPDDAIDMQSTYFQYIYEVGSQDLYGGLYHLTDVYTAAIITAYSQTLMLHVAAFAMCCGLGFLFLVFIMRPNYQRTQHEARRVAELLSQLPPDLAVEALVAEVLQLKEGQTQQDKKDEQNRKGRQASQKMMSFGA